MVSTPLASASSSAARWVAAQALSHCVSFGPYIRLHVVAYLSEAFLAPPPAGFILPCRPPSSTSHLLAWTGCMRSSTTAIDPRPQGRKPSDHVDPPRHEFHRQVAEGRGGGLQFGGRQRADRWRGGHVSLGRAFRFCRAAHKGGLGEGLPCRVRSLEPQRRGSPSAPAEERRAELSPLVAGVDCVLFSDALLADGALVFAKACELGLEGIVSKRAGSRYSSGTSRQWLKSKNPAFVRG